MPERSDVFPAPRIIDAAALDRVTESLRQAVEAARSESARLSVSLGEVNEHDDRIREATRLLQDRLTLGARMLKAFGAQIERMEALSRASEQQSLSPETVHAGTATIVARFEKETARAIEHIEQAAAASIDRVLREAANREEAIARRTAESAERAAAADLALARLRESLDRADQASRQSEGLIESLRPMVSAIEGARGSGGPLLTTVSSLVESAAHERRLLQESLLAREEQVESVEMRMSSLRQRMLESTMLCEARASELESRMSEFDASGQRLSSIASAATEIRAAIERLSPWADVLGDSGADGVQRRAVQLANSLREAMAAEMRRAASAIVDAPLGPELPAPKSPLDVAIEVKGHRDLLEGLGGPARSIREIESLPSLVVAQPAD